MDSSSNDPTTRFPSKEARSWVADSFSPGARVVGGRRLIGGVTSSVHRLTVEDKQGRRHFVVLRRWVEARDRVHAGSRITREAEVLKRLQKTGLPVPRLLAADPQGKVVGDPAILMTRAPGHVALSPKDLDEWLRQMAAILPRIHAAELVASPYRSWQDPAELEVPTWARTPQAWREAINLARGRPSPYEGCFIHTDYQPFNVLWSGMRLSGVVDWVDAAIGPRDVDVAHCRLGLAVLSSTEWAERFRLAYEAEAGRGLDPWWDIETMMRFLPGWGSFIQKQAGGLKAIDLVGMKYRVEELLKNALKRL